MECSTISKKAVAPLSQCHVVLCRVPADYTLYAVLIPYEIFFGSLVSIVD